MIEGVYKKLHEETLGGEFATTKQEKTLMLAYFHGHQIFEVQLHIYSASVLYIFIGGDTSKP
jgi:hypothetical protein